jgi:hypothetical protein
MPLQLPTLPRPFAVVLAAGALALAPRPAHAWNKAGHMLTGVIAYRALAARAPLAADSIVALLKRHPDYERQWRGYIAASGRPEGEMLFALAARWPDDVRGDSTYHRSAWHYVNLPLVPPGDTSPPPATVSGELLTVLPRTLAVLRDSTATAELKAVALCWLFHLTGDIHQPLHAVTLVSARWPSGDRGGNLFWVRPGVVDRPLNLHSFWDDVVLPDQDARPSPVDDAAGRLMKAFPRDSMTSELATLDAVAWARDESVPLARSAAYRDFTMPGGTEAERAPIVPSGYRADSRRVAERRIVVASYRLAAKLEEALPPR